jgi:ubiquitin carboxyl-terminal hydrolase 14
MKCDECEDEVVQSEEKLLQLSCFISEEIKYMHSGLISKLVEKITKHSETLGRDAVYTKSSKIDRLPAYLTVQMVRFYFKRAGINAKMLRDVKFPLTYDAFDMCSEGLKERLKPMREVFRGVEENENVKKLSIEGKDKEKEKEGKVLPFQFADGGWSYCYCSIFNKVLQTPDQTTPVSTNFKPSSPTKGELPIPGITLHG